jgi:hypothetical protein
MGWASGSQILEDVWNTVKKHIPKNKHKTVAAKLVDIFENSDCDTVCEVEELCALVHDHGEEE